MSKPNLHVAIAILLHQGQVLVGWREAQQHQGNKHEFPGGKVEEGETPVQACRREVQEETGIRLDQWHAFDFIRHEYDDLIVNLHLFQSAVPAEAVERIKAPWQWYSRDALQDLNFPKANKPMLKRLFWPKQIKISEDLSQTGPQRLLYWRTEASAKSRIALSERSVEQLGQLIVNAELWNMLTTLQQQNIGAVHLKHQQLMQLRAGDLQTGVRYIAACHDEASLLHAAAIGCDAALLSAVLPTATHEDAQPLGWEKFEQLAQQVQIPVFALGGMHADMLLEAQSHRAYGIAGIRHL